MPALAFEPTEYALPVLSRAELKVRVLPPTSGAVTFALVGASLDASLEAERADVDAEGVARVVLTTASQPTTFSVRASIENGRETEAPIEVGETPSGSVSVSTKYSGIRHVKQYRFSIYPDQDCASPGLNQLESTIAVVTSSPEAVVGGVPLSKSLAVVVKGDEVVHGCATTRAVAGQNSVSIQVPLDDLPVDLSGATLDLALTTTEGKQTLTDNIRTAIPTFVAQFVPGNHDLIQLLTVMEQVATGSLRQEFSDARRGGNWDALVVTAYEPSGEDVLRTALRRWLESGTPRIASTSVSAQLILGADEGTTPKLKLLRIADLDATTQLETRSGDLAVLLEPNDHLSWSARTTVGIASLFSRLAQEAAATEFPTSTSLSAQLAQLVDCAEFGDRLDSHVVWAQSNPRTCNKPCLATLCQSALELMSQAALEAPLGGFDFVFNASGTVAVDAYAKPTQVSGSWVGALLNMPQDVSFSGVYTNQ